MNALIGYSGFVGSTLQKQTQFDRLYRSINIHDIETEKFNYVVCAGAPAQKWIANNEPQKDEDNINTLINHLQKIEAKKFVLISTVDVFKNPINVTEKTHVDESDLQAYGLNRRKLEKFVESHFENFLIVRLPGLVGPGLKKNILYDFKNNNNIEKIESRSIYQFYPMVNLWTDIKKAFDLNISHIHLTAEPIAVNEIARDVFNMNFKNEITTPVEYNFQSIYAKEFDGSSSYQYSKKEVLLAIRSYAQG
jgi:nucleoside-diphosphate-sugar epimerase